MARSLKSEYSHGMRGVLGASPGRIVCFLLPCGTKGLSRWFRHGSEQIEEESHLAGEIVTGLPCNPIAQWLDYSHGLRGSWARVPVESRVFFSPD